MKVVGGYQVSRLIRKEWKPLDYRFDGPEVDHIRAWTTGADRVLIDKDWDVFLKAIGVQRVAS
jgi:hypothetical protein